MLTPRKKKKKKSCLPCYPEAAPTKRLSSVHVVKGHLKAFFTCFPKAGRLWKGSKGLKSWQVIMLGRLFLSACEVEEPVEFNAGIRANPTTYYVCIPIMVT